MAHDDKIPANGEKQNQKNKRKRRHKAKQFYKKFFFEQGRLLATAKQADES